VQAGFEDRGYESVATDMTVTDTTRQVTPRVASRALPSTASSVVEKTIFSSGCQMSANSRSTGSKSGFSSTVSQ